MIRTVNIDGQEMTAIVLGDTWETDINDYRNALFEILEMAFMNDKACDTSVLNHQDIFWYTKLLHAIDTKEDNKKTKKGGEI